MKDKIKAIEIALKNESTERDFYLKQAERSADPLGKKMFSTIAREEEEHYRYLQELHVQLQRQGKWPEKISAVIKDTDVNRVLDELVGKVQYQSAATADDREAVRIAIDFEKKAHEFYTNLKKKSDHPDEKDLFDRLASLEYEHIASLEQTLLFFDNPAEWFAQHEKPHFEA